MEPTKLLIFSQAALSLALPLTILPLIFFNASEKVMGPRKLRGSMLFAALGSALFIIGLNVSLLLSMLPTELTSNLLLAFKLH
jgi:Mn2+/Fe2+ NRAMP family transporter